MALSASGTHAASGSLASLLEPTSERVKEFNMFQEKY
jgi:hypothetical protein